MKKLLLLLISVNLWAYGEGCTILSDSKPKGCSIDDILKMTTLSELEKELSKKAKKMPISEGLEFVDVLHDDESLRIIRVPSKEAPTCPPFCIEPMRIDGVTTVGELETLDFIAKLKEKKARLLIDVRENIDYEKSTIPGAINLPFSMLKDGSKYQEQVLKLLGAKLHMVKSKDKWIFKNAQSLLIFGTSATSNEASSAIKQLLKLGYPKSKLLYYRSGISAWKALALTTY